MTSTGSEPALEQFLGADARKNPGLLPAPQVERMSGKAPVSKPAPSELKSGETI
ncbi:MAG: hypothetical protein JXB15_03055 [Anaerolineales bacterium]|nr:hypothetical protein [Anaerolineales bacterium]